jgi:transposase
MEQAGQVRRRHSAQFKQRVLSECARPGASVAAVALAHGVNANLVHKWRQRERRPVARVALPATVVESKAPAPAFVPLPMAAALPAEPAEPIRIELIRGGTTIRVQWPLSAAAQCTAWLRELL